MRSRARLLRALLYAFGLLVVGGVGAVSWMIGSAVAHRKAVPAAPWRPVALGPATLEAPAGWQPEALSAPGVQGLPEPAAAFATVPGLQAHAVLAIAPAGRSPSASVTLKRLLGPLGTPRRSQVAGRPAQRYAARPVPGDRMAEATLAPVAAGTLLILCIAKSAAWTGAAGCADALRPRSLRIVPATT
jgi:hypothetical protein